MFCNVGRFLKQMSSGLRLSGSVMLSCASTSFLWSSSIMLIMLWSKSCPVFLQIVIMFAGIGSHAIGRGNVFGHCQTFQFISWQPYDRLPSFSKSFYTFVHSFCCASLPRATSIKYCHWLLPTAKSAASFIHRHCHRIISWFYCIWIFSLFYAAVLAISLARYRQLLKRPLPGKWPSILFIVSVFC